MPITPPFETDSGGSTLGLSGIQYWEDVEAGYSEAADMEGNTTATRTLYCTWADRKEFRRAMLGWSQIGFGGGGTLVLRRALPQPHPDMLKMYCTKCDLIRGAGVPQYQHDSGLIAYYAATTPAGNLGGRPDGKAYFRVEYTMLPFDVKKDTEIAGDETLRYIDRSETFSVESITLPGKCFQFATFTIPNLPRTIPEGLPKLVFGGQYMMKWMQIPSENNRLPIGLRRNIKKCTNHLNLTAFEGYDIGTLLCFAPQIERKRNITGIDVFDITYLFGVKEKEDFTIADQVGGWNTVYRRDLPTGPGYDRVEAVADTDRSIYLYADFAALFNLNET